MGARKFEYYTLFAFGGRVRGASAVAKAVIDAENNWKRIKEIIEPRKSRLDLTKTAKATKKLPLKRSRVFIRDELPIIVNFK